jgi:translation initiation factor IF-2
MIALVADIQNLKADPIFRHPASFSKQKSTRAAAMSPPSCAERNAEVGDNFVAGAVYGKVRAMFDERSEAVKEAAPSTPVEVLGLQGLPLAGDSFQSVDDERARQVAQYRQEKLRETAMSKNSRLTLDQLHRQLAEGEVKEVAIVLKCDVQGSQEALSDMLTSSATTRSRCVSFIRALAPSRKPTSCWPRRRTPSSSDSMSAGAEGCRTGYARKGLKSVSTRSFTTSSTRSSAR